MTPIPQGFAFGSFLTFGPVPGALCYGIYSENNGVFTPIAQCVQPHTFATCCAGCYKFSVITSAGEGPLSDPVCTAGALIEIQLPSDPTILGYNIYREVDPLNPGGTYALIFSGTFFNLFLACAPGCYSFTAITADGETPFNTPFCIPQGGCNSCSLLQGLLAYWKMDELAGQDRSDATGNGWTAQNFGRTPVAPGIFNLALKDALFGGPQGLHVNPLFDARPSSTPWSYQLWYHFEVFRSGNTIAGEWGGGTNDWRLTTPPAGGFQWEAYDDSGNLYSIQDSTVLTPGTWYHIILRWDGHAMQLWVNGVNTAISGPGNLSPNGSPVGIRRAHNRFWFDNDETQIQQPGGTFDESGYWNRALTTTEIAKLYNNGAGLQYPFCSTPPTPPPPTLLTGIRAYWKFDEASGNRLDSTGNGFTAVATGACPSTMGKINLCLQDPLAFPQALTVNSSIDTNSATSPFSMQCWYQFEIDRSDNTVLGEWGGGTDDWKLSYHATGFQVITWNWSAHDTGGTLFVASAPGNSGVPGTWFHIVMVWDGANMNLYINGSLAAQAPGAPTNIRRAHNNLVFDNDSTGIQQPAGNFDEAAYWVRALTATEVAELYNNGLALAYPF